MTQQTRSSGDFCPIAITHSTRHGLRVWAIRNPKHRVDGPGVMLNTILSERCFESGNGLLSPFIPTSDLAIN